MYSVYRQEIPWRLFLLTAYVPMREGGLLINLSDLMLFEHAHTSGYTGDFDDDIQCRINEQVRLEFDHKVNDI